jgi:Tol biopolymer transport system component
LALTHGTRLGPYEILSALGAGGMGEVYKARDTRLDRLVAIKILPEALAADPQFRERFDREARAISQLTHPHICTLYDVGREPLRRPGLDTREGDGPSASGVGLHPIDFLVMELLDGETLADRLKKGALPLDQALTIAIAIASALDHAHRAAIVHRDLKPGNVMLTKAGAKLLDFGLAKSRAPVVAGSSLSMLPTSPANLTAQGTILGTFQYMAPEQLEGQDADARTDIFAFGVVVYEMLTGHKAFEGKTQASLIGAIMHATPPPIAAIQPLAPAALNRIVTTCLAKDPDERWQAASDVMRELKWIAESASQATAATATTVSAVAVPDVSRRRPVGVAWAAVVGLVILVVLLIGAMIPAVLYFRRAAPDRNITRLELATPATSDPVSMALSPDGRQIAFVAAGEGGPRLWVRRFDQAVATALPGTDGAAYPFWAPDGRAIGFFAAGKLKRVDLSGGAPQVLADAGAGRGGAWSADGVILFSPTASSGLLRMPAKGGMPAAVTEPKSGENSHRWPQFLPDGHHFLFRMAVGRLQTRGTYVGSLEGGTPTRVLEDDAAAVFAPPDLLLVVRQGVLMAVRFDPARAVVSGDPVPVAQNVGTDTTIERGAFTVSATGVLAHRPGGSQRRQLVWVDRAGHTLGTVGGPDDGAPSNPSLAPDGQRAAVARVVQGNGDIWLLDARGVLGRFTFDTSLDTTPVWSPDGRRLVFRSNRNGVADLFEKAANGAADEQPLLVTPENKAPQDFSPDGRTLLYTTLNAKTGVDLWAVPLDGDKKPFPVLQSAFDEMDAQFSPDGRWIAYESNQSGQSEIFVRPFPESRGQWQVSTAGGAQPRWRADGKELFYVTRDGHMMATPIATAPDGLALVPGAAATLFALRLASGTNVTVGSYGGRPQYAVARDGRFLVDIAADTEATPPIAIVLNWDAQFRK